MWKGGQTYRHASDVGIHRQVHAIGCCFHPGKMPFICRYPARESYKRAICQLLTLIEDKEGALTAAFSLLPAPESGNHVQVRSAMLGVQA
jgi:hypothetical protein